MLWKDKIYLLLLAETIPCYIIANRNTNGVNSYGVGGTWLWKLVAESRDLEDARD